MKKNIFLGIFLLGMFFVSAPMVSLAQNAENLPAMQVTPSLPPAQTVTPSLSPAQTVTPAQTNAYTLQNPLNFSSICGLVKAIFNVLLELGVPIAVLFLVYAGFKFIIARGSDEGIKKAKDNLVNVVIGIAIFLGAWLLGQAIAATINSLAVAANQPSVTGNSCN